MFVWNGKEWRNLEEQVQENMEDLIRIRDAGLLLAQLGIKVVGKADTEGDLPDPATYYPDDRDNHYGDAYAVGAETPYTFYIFTRPFEGEDGPSWFSIGVFPAPGVQGPAGPAGTISSIDSIEMQVGGAELNTTIYTATIKIGSQEFTGVPVKVEDNFTWAPEQGIDASDDLNNPGKLIPEVCLYTHDISIDTAYYDENQGDIPGFEPLRFRLLSFSATPVSSFSDLLAKWGHSNNYTIPCHGIYINSSGTVEFLPTWIYKPNANTLVVVGYVYNSDYYEYQYRYETLTLTQFTNGATIIDTVHKITYDKLV